MTLVLQILIYAFQGYVDDPPGIVVNGTGKKKVCNVQLITLSAESFVDIARVPQPHNEKLQNILYRMH